MRKKTQKKVDSPYELFVLNGPNLNMLGLLDTQLYGSTTILELKESILAEIKTIGVNINLNFFQTNHEGEILDYIHNLLIAFMQSRKTSPRFLGVIINPSTWAHTSLALRDALELLKPTPLVEVHCMNLLEMEEHRQHSVLEDIVDYRIMGMGPQGYIEALKWLVQEGLKDRVDLH